MRRLSRWSGPAVVLGLLGLGPQTAAADVDFAALGGFSAPAVVLLGECAAYPYAYHVAPPTDDWILEVFVVAPDGTGVASEVVTSGADASNGTKSFRLCPPGPPAGAYTISGRLTYQDYPAQHSGWITPATFSVSAPTVAPTVTPERTTKCVKARKKAKRLGTRQARRKARQACRS